MSIPDFINGAFEAFGGLFCLMNCAAVIKDKGYRGIYVPAQAFCACITAKEFPSMELGLVNNNNNKTQMKKIGSLLAAAFLLFAVTFITPSAKAANPCCISTISSNAGANCSLRSGNMIPGYEYVFAEGDPFTAFYTGGCAQWGGFAVARIRDYVWNKTLYRWDYVGYVDITLGQYCESTGGILHSFVFPDCSDVYGGYQPLQTYCPCSK